MNPWMNSRYREAVRKAKEQTPLLPDGGYDEPLLHATVKSFLPDPDVDAIKDQQATDAINQEAKAGNTPPRGQMVFEGFPPRDYEPERLIRDDDGHIIENRHSTPHYKGAHLRRSQKKHAEHGAQLDFDTAEYMTYTEWRSDHLFQGRRDKLEFEDFLEETGRLRKPSRSHAAD
jgi:hypothetical protein